LLALIKKRRLKLLKIFVYEHSFILIFDVEENV
ncbi:unnamed protein product, partial [marine sediment metagenome]